MFAQKKAVPNFKKNHKKTVAQFQVRNSLAIGLVFLGLTLGFIALMAMDFNKLKEIDNHSLKTHFNEQVLYLDNLLRQVTSRMELMRSLALSDLLETRNQNKIVLPQVFRGMAVDENLNYYHLDNPKEPFSTQMIGNLTGDGSLKNRDNDFLREIRMALNLNPLFQSTQTAIQTTAWVYYVSANKFLNLYPWVDSKEWRFTTQTLEKELFTLALPKNNPDQKAYWTEVYIDEVGKGLMTTCGIPVYDNERFIGTIALDLTVDFLNVIVGRFQPEKGKMFLVNDRNQILAHPQITSSKDIEIKRLPSAIPADLKASGFDLDQIPRHQIVTKGRYQIITATLETAPWQVVYIENIPGLWQLIKERVGLLTIAFFTGLLVLVLIILFATHFLYILPSEKFVQYILLSSKGEPADFTNQVPEMWKPWFTTIQRTFHEKEMLTRQIKEYSQELEERVNDRTAKLVKLNEQLRLEIGERERAQNEEKKTARLLDAAISQSPSGIIIADAPDIKIRMVNKAAFDIRGEIQTSPSQIDLHKYFSDWQIFDEKGTPYSLKDLPLSQAIRNGKSTQNEELIIKDKTGTDHWLSVNAAPIIDTKGNITAGIIIFHDITSLKQKEKDKLEAQQFAADQAKHALVGQIAGKMAHDFNNVLGAIMGNTELALLDVEDAQIKKTLGLILGQTIRGKNLTKNLTAFAKNQEPRQKFLKVYDLIELVVNLLRKDLNQIELKREDAPDMPDLLADPGMIEHALVNLLQNSIHAVSLTQYQKIVIRTYCSTRYICIEIQDNGCGIPEEHLNNIFEPSFTLKGSRDVKGVYAGNIKGTGYGMANVKKYIDQHKGNIKVESHPGSGTKVTLELPFIKKGLTAQEKNKIDQAIGHTGKYILIVEDESTISDVQCRILTEHPCYHRVDIANNGPVAFELLEKNNYDCISLDYMLSGDINGMDIYHHIRKTNKTMPVLFISGNIEFLESIKCLKQEDPRMDHLSKPCQNREYVLRINDLLGKNQTS
ncbi:MAG: response regulator [Proteobacteria bacterium]|nr:response regulator [Pseudomonadota bacterium]MBU1585047.1 response regulator [Pseudomonadota bacterium]MBU2451738.1 response regulator [Pseudomonadota bacterium]MBU2628310.1 response regulator [Pseudomonadota bacterium]